MRLMKEKNTRNLLCEVKSLGLAESIETDICKYEYEHTYSTHLTKREMQLI